eukprot:Gb_32129 [translate_table: standard]
MNVRYEIQSLAPRGKVTTTSPVHAKNANRGKHRRAHMCDEFSIRQYKINFSPIDGRLLSSFALQVQSTSFTRKGLAPGKLIIGSSNHSMGDLPTKQLLMTGQAPAIDNSTPDGQQA